MDSEERYENFIKEYEKLCTKYQMSHRTVDLWDVGHEEIHVYDEKTKLFIFDQM